LVWVCCALALTSHSQDLCLLRRTLDADAALASQDRLTSDDADAYYARTTDVDYRALELCVGPGMHTELCASPPILRYGGHTRQAVFVLAEVSAVHSKRARGL
jgi:hypothetical protein